MALPPSELERIAQLAYLDTDSEFFTNLARDVSAIMDFVEQLKQVPTAETSPLFHPLDLHQHLRSDEVTESNCRAKLAEIAPVFTDNLYIVPHIIDTSE
jgi:aspartyl-tRNA(Asn)/glutamyl-tRNA(Gln) amidotransferase subunit C